MLLILKNTDYAMRALCHMAHDSEKIYSVGQLSDDLDIPGPFLKRILQKLEDENILSSFRGRSGGFKLIKDPNMIFLLDLVRIFQGPIKLEKCVIKEKICPDIKVCLLKKTLEKIDDFIKQEFESITIEKLKLEKGDNL